LNAPDLEPADPYPAAPLIVETTWAAFGAEHWPWLLVIGLLLLCSAIFSGYEVAFFSGKPDEPLPASERSFLGRCLLRFRQNPQEFIATLLISNNLVNVAIVMISAMLLGQLRTSGLVTLDDRVWAVVDVVLITALVLFVGEITPKVLATYRRAGFLRTCTGVLYGAYVLLRPLSWLLARTSRLIRYQPADERREVSYQELRKAIDLTPDAASPREEKQILKALVNLGNISVRAIMRARVDVRAVDVRTPTPELLRLVAEYGHSRIPAYAGSLDEIRGILYIKDLLPLLRNPETTEDWTHLLREPYFVPEGKKINNLFNEFKEKKLHFAVVVDEYGGTAGIVTLEDILEEIFGEIGESGDESDLPYSQLSDTEFVFDGKMPLLDVCRIVGLDEHTFDEVKGETDSLGGLILELHGRFPQRGATLRYSCFEFTIEALTATPVSYTHLRAHET
jgi:gliding motility-associated protein GldE